MLSKADQQARYRRCQAEHERRYGKTTFVLAEYKPRSAVLLHRAGDEEIETWMSEDGTIYEFDTASRKWSRLTKKVFVRPHPWAEG